MLCFCEYLQSSQLIKEFTRKGMELHLQTNSSEMKSNKVLHLILLVHVYLPHTPTVPRHPRIEETANCEPISASFSYSSLLLHLIYKQT